ncbi:MAG: glycosyltransferase family 39 protein, partial [Planctomycetota bacterium]
MFRLIEKHPVILVLSFASILRFWGIWHGAPFSFYPDELHFVNRAVSFGSGDLNPHWFHKPAFLMYILFFEYGLFFLIGKLVGMFSSVDGFAIYYLQNTWPFILIGRITVTIFGIATIYVVYKIGEKFWSKTAGSCCAILLTLSYGHIFCGQDIKADVPTTFFTVISIYFLLKVVNNNSFNKKDYILAGLFAGLGTATKYYSIALLPCILIVSIYEIINKRNILLFKKYLYSLLTFWGIYFIVSPYNFLDPLGRKTTFASIIGLFNKISPFKLNLFSRVEGTVVDEHKGNYVINSTINYIKVLFTTEGVGIVIGILFISSICYFMFRPSRKKIVLMLFPILFSVFSIVINPSYTEPRHQLIIYPFLSVVAGIFIYEVSKKFTNKSKVFIVLSLLLLFPAAFIIKNNLFISKTDTRTLAKYWIESNIPPGTKLLLDSYSPKLKMNKENIEEYYEKSKKFEQGQFTTHSEKYYNYQLQAVSGITYDIKEIRHIWWRNKEIANGVSEAVTEYDKDMANPIKTVGINEYEFYVKNGFEYVVTSSIAY